MGRIWTACMVGAAVLSLIRGTAGQASAALLASGEQAVTLLMTLLGTMTMWSGLMEILCASGDVGRLGKVFRRLLRPMFSGLKDDEAWNAISMNLSANLLGLGNAATPAGIEAARRLAVLGEPGLRALATLLALDNASLQLIPTTVITLRQSAGAANPADIWGMTLAVSGVSTAAAMAAMIFLNHGGGRDERRNRRSPDCCGGPDRCAGMDHGL